MAVFVESHHSSKSRIHGSAGLLLIQSLCGPWSFMAEVHLFVKAQDSPKWVHHDAAIGPSSLQLDASFYHRDNGNRLRDSASCEIPGSGCNTEHVSLESEPLDILEERLRYSLGNKQHEDWRLSELHNGRCNGTVPKGADHREVPDSDGFSITILPGIVYNFPSMMLYLNIHISVTVVIALAFYMIVTLFGLYRFVETIREYFIGCSCRLCNDEFIMLRPIEGGAYGRISLASYVGSRRQFDFKVVLKSIPIEGVFAISVTQQECRKLLSLNHRYVMKYYDDFLHREWSWNPLVRDKLYCVMVTEFCERGNLADLIENEYSGFTEEYILCIFKKVVIALQYIHEQSVIHRDIKSPNIMLKENDVVRLGDFGLSDTFASSKAFKKAKPSNTLEIAALVAKNNKKGKKTHHMYYPRGGSFSSIMTSSEAGRESMSGNEDVSLDDEEDVLIISDDVIQNIDEEQMEYFAIPDIRRSQSRKGCKLQKGRKNRKRGKNRENQQGCIEELYNTTSEPETGKNPRRRRPSRSTRSKENQMFQDPSSINSSQIGTRCYMAPEIMTQSTYGRASDIWALGCVLLELCSGVFMWEHDYYLGEVPEEVPSLIAKLPPMISRSTRGLLAKMLSVDPEKRPSAAQILSSKACKLGAKRNSRGQYAAYL